MIQGLSDTVLFTIPEMCAKAERAGVQPRLLWTDDQIDCLPGGLSCSVSFDRMSGNYRALVEHDRKELNSIEASTHGAAIHAAEYMSGLIAMRAGIEFPVPFMRKGVDFAMNGPSAALSLRGITVATFHMTPNYASLRCRKTRLKWTMTIDRPGIKWLFNVPNETMIETDRFGISDDLNWSNSVKHLARMRYLNMFVDVVPSKIISKSYRGELALS